MATLRAYKCQDCGLTATVSGGEDALFSGPTNTFYCKSCETLQDIVLPLVRPSLDAPIENNCSSCNSTHLVEWSSLKPCPRCNGSLALDPTDNFVIDAD
ncbi:hypothetical protein LNL84_08675 [Vibrio sp. ZSDZ34]|uniref:Uncharacterized protein n=1 Tax=Vibrio gelatinilyticus TaxID=2893468 RepID=A0A9X1WB13_9VIBR|nr:hypothetical protein [Vibrio gelatinilyticus]MCJ2376909.1 hypothetical protein [Vibrio gelatinilyticus]